MKSQIYLSNISVDLGNNLLATFPEIITPGVTSVTVSQTTPDPALLASFCLPQANISESLVNLTF